ncbi:class I SAM-dependent methyltransferase [Candidatus Woesearchaeota archaeon]|nr:class I SAM-dependent methyltransferase [Candidatus Woesearchaeota archaeon]
MSSNYLAENEFEQRLMNKSWKKEHTSGYRNDNIDNSIISFNNFLKEKKITGRLLDIGCGNGKNSVFFANNGFSAVGIDFAPNAIKKSLNYVINNYAATNINQPNPNVQFLVADILNENIVKKLSTRMNNKLSAKIDNKQSPKNNLNKFDVIIDCGCLHHLRRKYWQRYLRNITRLLKSGGYYYLHGFSNQSFLLGRIKKSNYFRVRHGHYTCFFSEKEIQRKFSKDFNILKTYEFPNSNAKFLVRAFYMQKN